VNAGGTAARAPNCVPKRAPNSADLTPHKARQRGQTWLVTSEKDLQTHLLVRVPGSNPGGALRRPRKSRSFLTGVDRRLVEFCPKSPKIGVGLGSDAVRSSHIRTRLSRRRNAPLRVAREIPAADGRQVRTTIGRVWTERGRLPEGYFTKRRSRHGCATSSSQAERGVLPGMVRTGRTLADAAGRTCATWPTIASASRRQCATRAR
jgi:hypothetical protein